MRPEVVRMLDIVRRKCERRDRTKCDRVVVSLAEFFMGADKALLASEPDVAERSMRGLLDARADALNVLTSTVFGLAGASSTDIVDEAVRCVDSTTWRTMIAIMNKHGARSPSLRATDWRPPHPSDARTDARYHVHL